MANPADSPRAKLEFLYRDVLGEVTNLVTRLEAVTAEFAVIRKNRVVEGAAETLARAAGASSAKLRTELEASTEMAARRLVAVVQESTRIVREVRAARRRDYVIWGVVYFGASAFGGSIVALVLSIR